MTWLQSVDHCKGNIFSETGLFSFLLPQFALTFKTKKKKQPCQEHSKHNDKRKSERLSVILIFLSHSHYRRPVAKGIKKEVHSGSYETV